MSAISRKRLELEDQLFDSIENKSFNKKLINEYIDTISVDISKAISPINNVSAPFIVSKLIQYANAIERKFPDISEFVEELLSKPIDEVIIHGNTKQ